LAEQALNDIHSAIHSIWVSWEARGPPPLSLFQARPWSAL
jgi:hypothetical protein